MLLRASGAIVFSRENCEGNRQFSLHVTTNPKKVYQIFFPALTPVKRVSLVLISAVLSLELKNKAILYLIQTPDLRAARVEILSRHQSARE